MGVNLNILGVQLVINNFIELTTMERLETGTAREWSGYRCFFEDVAFERIPEPTEVSVVEEFVTLKWLNMYCVIDPFKTVAITDYRKNMKTPDYFYCDHYQEGITKLFSLLCK